MSDERQSGEQSPVRELERESRRLTRLRLVAEASAEHSGDRTDEHDPDPQQAA